MGEEQLTRLKALADENRLKIVKLLGQRSVCVCELEGLLGLTQPAVSHHLRILRESGLVEDSRQGKWVFYSLDRNNFQALQQSLAELSPQVVPGGKDEQTLDVCKRCEKDQGLK